jgi:hypothetical protein
LHSKIIGSTQQFKKWPVLYLGLELTKHVIKSKNHSGETVTLSTLCSEKKNFRFVVNEIGIKIYPIKELHIKLNNVHNLDNLLYLANYINFCKMRSCSGMQLEKSIN